MVIITKKLKLFFLIVLVYKKVLSTNQSVVISGKINYYKNNYQITNPTIKPVNQVEEIAKIFQSIQ